MTDETRDALLVMVAEAVRDIMCAISAGSGQYANGPKLDMLNTLIFKAQHEIDNPPEAR